MKTVFINGIVLDGTENMQAQKGLAVVVEGENIAALEPQADSYPGCEVVDLGGRYIMPGLINLHVHLTATGDAATSENAGGIASIAALAATDRAKARELIKEICKKCAESALMSGTTTMRTVGGIDTIDTEVRELVEKGELDGSRILASDSAITVEGGHGAGTMGLIAHSPEEAAAFVRKINETKPDLIKLMVTGGVMDAKVKGEPGVLRMAPEIIKAACDEAHKLGLKVAAHIESPEGVRVGLQNGVDTIEHSARPDDEIIALFKERGAAHICTISPALPLAVFDPKENGVDDIVAFNAKVVFEGIINCAKECLRNGIPVGLGTDVGCPNITPYDMWRELNYFVKYVGVTPGFALYSATLGNAKIAGIDHITGSIEPGKCADLIVTEKNPLEDATACRNVEMVMARGKLFREPKVRKSPEVEALLDRVL